jgi:uncharacterized protein
MILRLSNMFDHYTRSYTAEVHKGYDAGLRNYILKVYIYMSIALGVTAFAAFLTLNFTPLTALVFNITPSGRLIGLTGIGTILSLAPIGISLYFYLGFGRLSLQASKNLMWVYAGLMGVSLSVFGILYTGVSLIRTVLICASLFGAMSIYGYTTRKDLTSFSSFVFMGMIGLMMSSLINMWLASPAIYFATSIVGVAISVFLVAWDTQNLKRIYYATERGIQGEKMAVLGAMNLYLDFLNLFIYLLRFFGERRSNE